MIERHTCVRGASVVVWMLVSLILINTKKQLIGHRAIVGVTAEDLIADAVVVLRDLQPLVIYRDIHTVVIIVTVPDYARG
jgi:hypothetical protein